eukprot:2392144-Pyramimonas_sp.AAC.1
MWLGFAGPDGLRRVSWSWPPIPRNMPSTLSASQLFDVYCAARKESLVPQCLCFPVMVHLGLPDIAIGRMECG